MNEPASTAKIPCCPPLIESNNCDVLSFVRALDYPIVYRDTRYVAQLLVRLVLKRCTLGLTLGDPVYTTTLFPGEKVQLVTTDRRSSFTYDADTKISHRSTQMSEEQYFMTATQVLFGRMEAEQSGNVNTTDKGGWNFKGDAEANVDPWELGVDAEAKASGTYDNSTALDYLHRQSSNMRSSATQALNATRKAYSLSIGEVSTRTHIEGESQDHFESSSRAFSNHNSCHAVSYFFYRLNKKVSVSLELVSIDKSLQLPGARGSSVSITVERREEVMKEIDKQLIAAGVLDANGEPGAKLRDQFDFTIESHLPTGGTVVKGCMDECNVCEPARREQVQLQNDLLRKQIELLEKSQEYRCCSGQQAEVDSGS
jgi:hypothetical protein